MAVSGPFLQITLNHTPRRSESSPAMQVNDAACIPWLGRWLVAIVATVRLVLLSSQTPVLIQN